MSAVNRVNFRHSWWVIHRDIFEMVGNGYRDDINRASTDYHREQIETGDHKTTFLIIETADHKTTFLIIETADHKTTFRIMNSLTGNRTSTESVLPKTTGKATIPSMFDGVFAQKYKMHGKTSIAYSE